MKSIRLKALLGLVGIGAGIATMVWAGIINDQDTSDFPKLLNLLGMFTIIGAVVFLVVVGMGAKNRLKRQQETAFLKSIGGASEVSADSTMVHEPNRAQAADDTLIPRARDNAKEYPVRTVPRLTGMAQVALCLAFPTLSAGVTLIGSKLGGYDANAPVGVILLVIGVAALGYTLAHMRKGRFHCPHCQSRSYTISESPLRDRGFFAIGNDWLNTCNDCGTISRIGPSFIGAIVIFIVASLALSLAIGFSFESPSAGAKTTPMGGGMELVEENPPYVFTKEFLFPVFFIVISLPMGLYAMVRSSRPPEVISEAKQIQT